MEISLSIWGRSGHIRRISSLVNPEEPIPPLYTKIHGIDDGMVREAPTFREFWQEHGEEFHGKLIIAHNLSFDLGMINRELMRLETRPLGNPGIDTVPVLKSLLPGEKSHRLQNLAKSLGIPQERRHRAEDDVRALEQILAIGLGKTLDEISGKLSIELSFWGGAASHRYFRDNVFWCQKADSPLSLIVAKKGDDGEVALGPLRIERPVCTTKRVGEEKDAVRLPWLWKDVRRIERS